jgi:hypothetical protein
MADLQNLIALTIVAAAVYYVGRAAYLACGYGAGNTKSGCGGCKSCSGSTPQLVEIGIGSPSAGRRID